MGISTSVQQLVAAIQGVGNALGLDLSHLGTNISNETTRAEGAEGTLTTNLNSEVTRAEGAEGTLTQNLNSEITTRQQDEAAINSAISALQTAVSGKANTTDMNTAINNAITQLTNSASFGSNGWVKFPVKLGASWVNFVIQWGQTSVPTGNGDVITYPMTYPTGELMTVASDQGSGVNGCACVGANQTNFQAYGRAPAQTSGYSPTSFGWLSIGH
jgi:hypothetical protein